MDRSSCSKFAPPPARSWAKATLLLALAAILLAAAPALAQTQTHNNVEVTGVGANCVWVEWEIDLMGGTAFQNQRAYSRTTDDVFGQAVYVQINGGATFYQFTGLTAETTYYFGIRGLLAGGGGNVDSDVVSATTLAAGEGDCGADNAPPNGEYYPEVFFLGSECLWLTWRRPPRVADTELFRVAVADSSNPPTFYQNIEGSPYLITGLTAGESYTIGVQAEGALEDFVNPTTETETTACPSRATVLAQLFPPEPEKPSSGSGSGSSSEDDGDVVPTPRPPDNTCPNMLPAIVVSGYVPNASQCQVVDGAGVGRQDLVNRGIVSAVDIWSLVPNTGVEVCFANMGAAVVFLDAAYSPRLLSTLEYVVRDGHTCTTITTTGTVVLLAS